MILIATGAYLCRIITEATILKTSGSAKMFDRVSQACKFAIVRRKA